MTSSTQSEADPRVADVPGDLEAALARDAAARAAFDRLPSSHQTEYVAWIEEAKRAETRARRIERTLALLREARDAR